MQTTERNLLTWQSLMSHTQSHVPWPVYKEVLTCKWASSALNTLTMGKIIFFEEKSFQGRHYECSSDSAELQAHLTRCNSIRVESGCWMAYEKPNYSGYQYMLHKGEYPDYHHWAGFNDCIQSCRMIPSYQGNYKVKIFERSDFEGQAMELIEDCPDLHKHFHNGDIFSANVMEGYWILHEHPNYSGRQYFLHPGEYRRFSEWGSTSPATGSLKRITELN
ncbi:crystallin, gamma MX isoform X1 [Pangasianodon hypophthalmus]|uniref:crystallin, gamma MX isoform X1 n=1 Tax=Pangasianodon hypophthalmus TaxID=310915 RepID=UPI0023071D36|nr:crystallin, gamma MX isoform X1 [Pangasianodon hypophthalmus]